MNPYIDDGNIRTFSDSVDDMELIWHRDREDRKVTIIEGDNWQLQMDDSLPVTLLKDQTYYIPKMIYHRIIKGQGNLKIRIDEC